MFSKFDVQISSEELHIHEPTEADLAEYHAWLDEQEADEEVYDDEEEYADPVDLYGAERENYAVRGWD